MINLERLNQLQERFEFLEIKLTQTLSAEEIKTVGQEYSELKIVVEKIQNYKHVLSELEELNKVLNDPELRTLAIEEKEVVKMLLKFSFFSVTSPCSIIRAFELEPTTNPSPLIASRPTLLVLRYS